jgi:hypothetical protein
VDKGHHFRRLDTAVGETTLPAFMDLTSSLGGASALTVRTDIRYVFIRGQLQSRDDRNTRLYNQFRARPR